MLGFTVRLTLVRHENGGAPRMVFPPIRRVEQKLEEKRRGESAHRSEQGISDMAIPFLPDLTLPVLQRSRKAGALVFEPSPSDGLRNDGEHHISYRAALISEIRP